MEKEKIVNEFVAILKDEKFDWSNVESFLEVLSESYLPDQVNLIFIELFLKYSKDETLIKIFTLLNKFYTR